MSELMHYASQYYDPAKAHEYYEQHKKLKGRTSTAGFNQTQKEAASYVKDQLNQERKSLAEKSKEKLARDLEAKKNDAQSDINSFVHGCQTEAARLRVMIESGKFKDDPQGRFQAMTELKNMRDGINKRRQAIMAQLGVDTANLRNQNSEYLTNLKSEYDKKYEDELSKIRGSGNANKKSSGSTVSITTETKSETPKRDFKNIKKVQTSKWARNRERRREKERKKESLGHSDILYYDGSILMSEIMESDNLDDLRTLTHSLLETK